MTFIKTHSVALATAIATGPSACKTLHLTDIQSGGPFSGQTVHIDINSSTTCRLEISLPRGWWVMNKVLWGSGGGMGDAMAMIALGLSFMALSLICPPQRQATDITR